MSHVQGGRFPSQDPDAHKERLAEAAEDIGREKRAAHLGRDRRRRRRWWPPWRRRDARI